jgi:putative pyruvate formate lyase activating enzyme
VTPSRSSVNKEFRRFEASQVLGQLKEDVNRLPWYLAVSLNRMPAKFLISNFIPCSLIDFKSKSEEDLWQEHRALTEIFLETWKKVRTGQLEITRQICKDRKSLMDLNVELVNRMLTHCNFCRWNCQIDRSAEFNEYEGARKHGTCQLESTSKVRSYFHHQGEEIDFRGTIGSGTIFFTSCNMRCSFCQNGDISTDKDNGIPITPKLLALIIWQLRMEGCHNTNWVGGDPTIHLHTIVKAISMLDSLGQKDMNKVDLKYIESVKSDSYNNYSRGWKMNSEYAFYKDQLFNSPQLWNSNFFMSEEAMRILRSLMDAWLPDFKFGPGKCALDLSRTPWYWDTVTNNLKLVHEWGENFIIRHLIMPNHVECCTKPVLDWIATNMQQVPINIMDQYYPDNICDPSSSKFRERYREIARLPSKEEIIRSYRYAKELGLNFQALSYEKSSFGFKV